VLPKGDYRCRSSSPFDVDQASWWPQLGGCPGQRRRDNGGCCFWASLTSGLLLLLLLLKNEDLESVTDARGV
jgi:hypothetical protein